MVESLLVVKRYEVAGCRSGIPQQMLLQTGGLLTEVQFYYRFVPSSSLPNPETLSHF
jgi:hypothetical protein